MEPPSGKKSELKYVPKSLQRNVNVSERSALRELVVLTGGLLGLLLVLYIGLGFAVDLVISRWPERVSLELGNYFSRVFTDEEGVEAAQSYVQSLVNRLAENIEQNRTDFLVHLKKEKSPNAFALPGGHIVVHTGLLRRINSENELSMVLAHEIGHFVNQDHMQGLGRGLVLFFISAIVFDSDSALTSFFGGTLQTAQMTYSRDQELAADRFGIELLYKTYGHVAGASDFFSNLHKEEYNISFLEYFSTHPMSDDRAEILDKITRKRRFPKGQTRPLRLPAWR